MVNRRELLKRFGIGTIIAPVVAGAADLSLPAKLIEVPQISLADNFQQSGRVLDLREVRSVTITFERNDGTQASIYSRFVWPDKTSRDPVFDLPANIRAHVYLSRSINASPMVFHRLDESPTITAEGMLI